MCLSPTTFCRRGVGAKEARRGLVGLKQGHSLMSGTGGRCGEEGGERGVEHVCKVVIVAKNHGI